MRTRLTGCPFIQPLPTGKRCPQLGPSHGYSPIYTSHYTLQHYTHTRPRHAHSHPRSRPPRRRAVRLRQRQARVQGSAPQARHRRTRPRTPRRSEHTNGHLYAGGSRPWFTHTQPKAPGRRLALALHLTAATQARCVPPPCSVLSMLSRRSKVSPAVPVCR